MDGTIPDPGYGIYTNVLVCHLQKLEKEILRYALDDISMGYPRVF